MSVLQNSVIEDVNVLDIWTKGISVLQSSVVEDGYSYTLCYVISFFHTRLSVLQDSVDKDIYWFLNACIFPLQISAMKATSTVAVESTSVTRHEYNERVLELNSLRTELERCKKDKNITAGLVTQMQRDMSNKVKKEIKTDFYSINENHWPEQKCKSSPER